MHREPERLGDDDVYELDRKAWNLPRARTTLTIALPQRAPTGDGSDQESHPSGDAKPDA